MSLYEVFSTADELNRMRENKPEKVNADDAAFEAFERRHAEKNKAR